jgi:competence protein ComEC
MILAWLAAAFVAGVVLGTGVNLPVVVWAAAALLFVVVAWPIRRRAALAAVCLAAGALSLGLARGHTERTPVTAHSLAYYNGRTVRVLGVVSQEPDVRDTGVNYVVSATTAGTASHPIAVSGSVLVHLPVSEELQFGDRVELDGRLETPQSQPGFDYRAYLRGRGIGSTMAFVRAADLGPGPSTLGFSVVHARIALERDIDEWLPEPEASLLIAICLGARSATLGSLAPAFISTGLIHIVAISGIKIAMIAGTVFELAALTRRRALRVVVASAVLLSYVALTGFTASGVRSALMWELVFVAFYLGRGTVALVSLGAAAAAMVALEPSLVYDVGFQMSVAGTFAIVAFAPGLSHLARRVPSPFREALAVTLAAQIGTFPVVLHAFGLTSPVGPVANALVLPLLPLSIILGFALCAVASVPAVAQPLADLLDALLRIEIGITQTLARIPAWHLGVPFGSEFAIGYYVLLAWLSVVVLRRAGWAPISERGSRGRELVVAVVVALLASTLAAAAAHGSRPTQLQWLGTGEALLLEAPNHAVLIDGSPHAGALLRALGAALPPWLHRIDLIVVTDPRPSNVSGLRAVLRRYTVGEVLDVGVEYPTHTYALWRSDLRSRAVPRSRLATGVHFRVDGVRITAIDPDAACPLPADCAGMLRLTMNGSIVLLAGTSSAREQRETLFRPVDIRAAQVVADTAYPLDGRFLRATGATAGHVIVLPAVAPPHQKVIDCPARTLLVATAP